MLANYWNSLVKSLKITSQRQNFPSSEVLNQMQYTTLGRTGLKVSVMGLGGGGYSRLGQGTGKSKAESIALVRQALELGINIIDTAETYRTEKIIGKAIKSVKREDVVISTKKTISYKGELIKPRQLVWGLEKSLWRLGTSYVDIYHLHGVKMNEYDYVLQELVPVLLKLRNAGKIRFIGITEPFSKDTSHQMLQRAVQDDCWDVIMAGFNFLNQSARERVFAQTISKNIGVLGMFAVRKALSNPQNFQQVIQDLRAHSLIDVNLLEDKEALDFLLREGSAETLTDAAYRYCRHEPGVNVVLFGTGNPEHLKANVASLLRPSLPEADLLKLKQLFGNIDGISGA